MWTNCPGIKLVWIIWKLQEKNGLKLIVHTTTKQAISRPGKNDNGRKMYKNENEKYT